MIRRSRPQRHKPGFLLFEVMVSVTVIGIGLAAVLQSISTALGTARTAKDYFLASGLLSEKLWEITSLGSVNPGVTEGSYKDHPAYTYRVEIEELFSESPPPVQKTDEILYKIPSATPQVFVKPKKLSKVTITLSWDYRGKRKKLITQTYVPSREEETTVSPGVTYIE